MTEMKGASRDGDAISFGLIVKRLRLERGWTVLQLAEAARINRVHVGVIERGGNSPSLRSFVSICYALGADPSDILREVLQNRPKTRQKA